MFTHSHLHLNVQSHIIFLHVFSFFYEIKNNNADPGHWQVPLKDIFCHVSMAIKR